MISGVDISSMVQQSLCLNLVAFFTRRYELSHLPLLAWLVSSVSYYPLRPGRFSRALRYPPLALPPQQATTTNDRYSTLTV